MGAEFYDNKAKNYELKDHLGNVRVVISDMKVSHVWDPDCDDLPNNPPPPDLPQAPADTIRHPFDVDLIEINNYYPFGMLQPGLCYNSEDYRFGFNGMEKDDEIKGVGNSYTTDYRMNDPRIGGRWLSLDPIVKPWESSYAGYGNNPIVFVDPEGNTIKGYDAKSEEELNKDLDNATHPGVFYWKQNYFLGFIGEYFGLETTKTYEINYDLVESLKSENKLNTDQLEIIDGFSKIIESNKTIIAVYAKSLDYIYVDFSIVGPEPKKKDDDMLIYLASTFLTEPSNDFKAYVILSDMDSFSNLDWGTYTANNNKRTLPYRPGRSIHEFLDEGLPWIKTGQTMDIRNTPKLMQVHFHNLGLKQYNNHLLMQGKPISPLRNGEDHE